MSGNIPGSGGSVLPGAFTDVVTQSRGASIPGGVRIAAFIGEGETNEVIVSSAAGSGNDGLDSTYTSSSGADGRHFILSSFPVISNRTSLFKNGVLLTRFEDGSTPPTTPGTAFDYSLNITTGQIALQTAHLVDQGGADWIASTLNTGSDGYLAGLTLSDDNAPTETWTVKCISVQRDGLGAPIAKTAKFSAFGSISGQKLDANGNPVVWVANGTSATNGILTFIVWEGALVYVEGDSFTIKVKSGVLSKNDTLTATYIPEINMNDAEFLATPEDVAKKHGQASTDNTLALACQLAFANGAPGIMCVQAAPSMPRRTSFTLSDGVTSLTTNDADHVFPLPVGVLPYVDSNIHFFVKNNTTNVETQVLPNKTDFYTIGTSPTVNQFITDTTLAPGGYAYGYTAIHDPAGVSIITGFDGYMTADGYAIDGYIGVFSSPSVVFDTSSLSGTITLKVIDATNSINNGTFTITSVSDGKLHVKGLTPKITTLISEGSLRYEVVDSGLDVATQAYVVVNKLVVPNGYSLRVTLIDTRDASFYDAGWTTAIGSLEAQECDIVVTLPKQTISAIFQNTLIHCKNMSAIKNKKERVLFCGAINGLTPSNLTGASPAAVEDIGILEGIQGDTPTEILAGTTEDLTNYSVSDAFGNTFRCVYFGPDQIVVQAGTDNVLLDGFYIAAAAAGYLSGVGNVAIPLTNKVLTGFTILRSRQFSTLVLEQLAQAGVTTLQPVAGGGRVVWGLTTTQSGYPEEQEISIVFIRDRLAKSLRGAFAGFIGIAENDNIIAALSARGDAAMNAFVSQGLITAYKDLNIVRDSVDPRQWNVTVKAQPTYPVNFIYIKVSLGLL